MLHFVVISSHHLRLPALFNPSAPAPPLQWSYHQTGVLPRRNSFVCRSYEKQGGVGVSRFFPFWNSHLPIFFPVRPVRCSLGTRFHTFPLPSAPSMLFWELQTMKPTFTRLQRLSCPECGSQTIHRSMRRGLKESILHRVFLVSPYRCDDCDHRYFRRRPSSAETPPLSTVPK